MSYAHLLGSGVSSLLHSLSRSAESEDQGRTQARETSASPWRNRRCEANVTCLRRRRQLCASPATRSSSHGRKASVRPAPPIVLRPLLIVGSSPSSLPHTCYVYQPRRCIPTRIQGQAARPGLEDPFPDPGSSIQLSQPHSERLTRGLDSRPPLHSSPGPGPY